MTRVTHLRFHNICQYDDFECDLSTGLTAVTGRNGAGKTTLFRGLVYGLTGLVDGSWGSQSGLQKDGATDPGFVEVTLNCDNEEYLIKRFSIQSVKFKVADSVTKNGELIVRRRKAVDEYLASLYGMPCALLFQLCWGRQSELATLLKSPAAVISSFLSQVFDTQYLEKLRTILKDAASSIPIVATSNSLDIEQLKASLADLPPVEEAEKSLVAIQADQEKLRTIEKELALRCNAPSSESTRLADLSKAEAELDELARQANTIRTQLKGKDRITKEQYEELVARKKAIANEAQTVNNTVQTHKAEKTRILDTLQQITSAIQELEISMSPQVKTCKLCGHDLTDLVRYREHVLEGAPFKSLVATFASEKMHMELKPNNWKELYTAYARELLDQLSQLLASMQSANSKLEQLNTDMTQATADLEELETQLKCELELHTLEEKAKVNTALRRHLSSYKGYSEQDKTNLDKTTGLLSRTDVLVKQKQQELLELKLKKAKMTTWLQEAETSQKLDQQHKLFRDHLNSIRAAMSSERAQARFMRSRITSLNKFLTHFMKLTGMPFSLTLDPDTRTFNYITNDGYPHPATHLSGAQQSMSAVAFQMALYATMNPKLNLYLVDEPSEALDEGNKIVMASMFERMNNLLPQVDGSMLVITRDQPIIDSCNTVIEITNNKETMQ